MPTVVALVPSLELLVLVRNGVAHLGEATADDGDDVLVPYLKASEELRGALDLDREAYWGEFVELVDSALKENVEKARLRAESALAIAAAGIREALWRARRAHADGDAPGRREQPREVRRSSCSTAPRAARRRSSSDQ